MSTVNPSDVHDIEFGFAPWINAKEAVVLDKKRAGSISDILKRGGRDDVMREADATVVRTRERLVIEMRKKFFIRRS